VNGALIPGGGNSEGQVYECSDAGAVTGTPYFYWLEDVSWSFQTVEHGPAPLYVPLNDGEHSAVGQFSVGTTSGLYRITGAAMMAAGIDASQLNPDTLRVLVGGQECPITVSMSGPVFMTNDFLMFYLPTSIGERACELAVSASTLRMESVYSYPNRLRGNVLVDMADDNYAEVNVSGEYVRYLVGGFTDSKVWIIDSSRKVPRMLSGYTYINDTNGSQAVYFSYQPAEGWARCLLTGSSALRDVTEIRKVDP
jgi:hypothetical protein